MKRLSEIELMDISDRCENTNSDEWYMDAYPTGESAYVGFINIEGRHEILTSSMSVEDAFFIAESRQDIPALLAEIERLRRTLKAIENLRYVSGGISGEDVLTDAITLAHESLKEDA